MVAHRSLSIGTLDRQIKDRHPGIVIGWIRTTPGAPSGHYPDDSGLPSELSDPDSKQEVRSLDPMLGPAFSRDDANRLVHVLISRNENRRRLYYVIWQGVIYSRNNGWFGEPYLGTDPHTNHPHISGWWEDDDNTTPWAIGDNPVSKQDVIDALNTVVPWQSGGVRQLAIAYGDNPDGISTRRLMEYVLAWTRYGERKLPVLTEQDLNNIADKLEPSTIPVHIHTTGGPMSPLPGTSPNG